MFSITFTLGYKYYVLVVSLLGLNHSCPVVVGFHTCAADFLAENLGRGAAAGAPVTDAGFGGTW